MKKGKFIQTFVLCISTSLISAGLNVCAMESNQMFIGSDVKPNDLIMVESNEGNGPKEEEKIEDVSESEEDKAEDIIKLEPIIFGELPALSEEERKGIVDLSKDDRLGQLIDSGLVNLHSGRDMGYFKTLLTMTDQYGCEKINQK